MNISGKNITIFMKEFNDKKNYRASLSRKNVEGVYENAYIDIKMPKGVELANKTKINITKGFLSFYNYTGKDDKQHTIWYVVVQEYTLADAIKEQEVYTFNSVKAEEFDNGMELPF